MSRIKKVVVKVGTHSITREDGFLNPAALRSLVEQIATLKQQGVDVILISSGSVGAGRSVLSLSRNNNKVMQRQVYSSLGQVKLMNSYTRYFDKHGLHCAQVLATKEDFRDRRHYLNMKNCLQALLKNHIVPIVNENDVVAINELMFTDNDELAGLVAAMIDADALMILTHVNGLYDGDPDHPGSRLIEVVAAEQKLNIQHMIKAKSAFGRGGMHTKLRVAQKAAKMGIQTWILNGKRKNILPATLAGKNHGTLFPAAKDLSNVKKWISYSDGHEKGKVMVNSGAENTLLCREKASSLLPVQRTTNPSDAEIRHALEGNLCRCTGYQHIVNAVQYAAKKMREAAATA